jgi:hypothetical protein
MSRMSDRRVIVIWGFKGPRRRTAIAAARLLGEDEFGRWLGVAKGDRWRAADHGSSGVFETSLVKLVPSDTFWTACFNSVDPLIDVDIVLPVRWIDDTLEEVDLELDILRFADGSVRVRHLEEFDQVREAWPMPDKVATQAEETCESVRALVEQGAEPFACVGRAWLTRFLAETGPACC